MIDFLLGLGMGGVVMVGVFWGYQRHLLSRAAMEGDEMIAGKSVTLLLTREYERLKSCERMNLDVREKTI